MASKTLSPLVLCSSLGCVPGRGGEFLVHELRDEVQQEVECRRPFQPKAPPTQTLTMSHLPQSFSQPSRPQKAQG